MTVCVGALCANKSGQKSKAIVVASDRMVTMGRMTEFEPDTPKIAPLTDKVVALTAGDALRAVALLHRLRASLPTADGATTVRQIAEAASAHYAQLRSEQIQADIFAPRGILMANFYAGQQTQMIPQLSASIDAQVMQFNYGLELMIAGSDDEGAHLFLVTNPGGQPADFGVIGFHAIGSGSIHAVHSMIGFRHTGARELNETIFDVYLSKKRGEAAPGVGRETDLLIITDTAQKWVASKDLAALDKLVETYQEPADKALKEGLQQLDVMRETEDA